MNTNFVIEDFSRIETNLVKATKIFTQYKIFTTYCLKHRLSLVKETPTGYLFSKKFLNFSVLMTDK